jgi:NADH dehydrogenase/NADH:ubiquinone oxidoreductase subunit G
MKKINLTINKQPVAVPENSTILDAARSLNIYIPTLCYLDECDPFTSCMVCVVHETESDRLLPSCSVRVSEGMVIDTESDFVKSAQKDTLDMLLIEHVGDCEAPCQRFP